MISHDIEILLIVVLEFNQPDLRTSVFYLCPLFFLSSNLHTFAPRVILL